ncbi:hypothetical protein I4U23_004730 [Adineta vaga]|nr:hypothetical protein I4U23_004730 [Adineta vaga]
MSHNLSSSSSLPSDGSIETSLTRTIKLVLFAVPLGPSLMCSLYIMLCFVFESNLRRRTNHVMIAIIIIDLIELIGDLIPISLPYLYTGCIHNIFICLYWVTGNYTLQGIAAWYMAWASIDRYLLIFYQLLRPTFIRHDLPLLIIGIFIVSWYIIITFTHPCSEDWFDKTKFLCGGPCFNTSAMTATIDWILIVLIPALLIIVVNLVLLEKVLFQKCRRLSGSVRPTTKKYRKRLCHRQRRVAAMIVIPLHRQKHSYDNERNVVEGQHLNHISKVIPVQESESRLRLNTQTI